MKISILDGQFAVCRFNASDDVPSWIDKNHFYTITKTDEELSLICVQDCIQGDLKVELNWKILKVEGPLDFGLTGILSSIAAPLAEAKISIFALSTFDTDYVMVKQDTFEQAKSVLRKSGFDVVN